MEENKEKRNDANNEWRQKCTEMEGRDWRGRGENWETEGIRKAMGRRKEREKERKMMECEIIEI